MGARNSCLGEKELGHKWPLIFSATPRISEINCNLTPSHPKYLHRSTDTTLLYLNVTTHL